MWSDLVYRKSKQYLFVKQSSLYLASESKNNETSSPQIVERSLLSFFNHFDYQLADLCWGLIHMLGKIQ